MKPRKVLLALILFVAAGVANVSAQTRVVTGQVTDAVAGASVDAARISVRGTTISVMTRADGSFTVGVPVGSVELVVLRIGYKRAVLTVGPGQSSVNVAALALYQVPSPTLSSTTTGVPGGTMATSFDSVVGAARTLALVVVR